MIKHTPGPWEYVENGKGYTIQSTIKGHNRYIASTVTYGTPTIKENWDLPNARLIAAAPELLQVCKNALRQFEQRYEPKNPNSEGLCLIIRGLRSVIKKAEET